MQAFEGVRVIDFTHVLAGPFCTYQLAVMGADVIKVESPGEPDMMRPHGFDAAMNDAQRGSQFVCQNGNKRAVSIDVHTEEGLAIARQLIRTADVLVENYRGGVMRRIGLGYDDVLAINPQIIYCSLTGFGHTGPKAEHPAYDNVIQAFSGLMSATGTRETHPVRVGPAVLDYGTGSQAAFAVASALFQRTKTGKGQHIDVAMTDAALMLMSTHVIDAQILGKSQVPFGNQNPNMATYSLFDTADGELMVGAFTNKQAARLWRLLDRNDIADMVMDFSTARFAESCAEHTTLLQQIFDTKSATEWEELLMENGVPAARVRRIDEAIDDPQVRSRAVIQDGDMSPATGAALQTPVAAFGYAHAGPALRSPAPYHGEHTQEVMREIGIDAEEVARLEAAGVLRSA